MSSLTKYINEALTKQVQQDYSFIDVLEDYIIYLSDKKTDKKIDDLKYLNYFYKFCKMNYGNVKINEITKDLFIEYLLYYLPKVIKVVSYKSAQKILDEMKEFTKTVKSQTNSNFKKIFNEVYYELIEEFPRIMQLKKELKIFLGYPVINYDPLIIDFEYYKKEKVNHKLNRFSPIMEQGYFEVIEVFGNSIIVLKKIFDRESYIKLIVNKKVALNLRNNDIIHMRVSRKLFFTTWNIEDVKGCYLKQAKKFLN